MATYNIIVLPSKYATTCAFDLKCTMFQGGLFQNTILQHKTSES